MEKEKHYVEEINCSTGEVTRREFTAEEYAQRDIDLANIEAERVQREAEEAAKAAAKQAAQEKLKALGLTDLEVAALSGI